MLFSNFIEQHFFLLESNLPKLLSLLGKFKELPYPSHFYGIKCKNTGFNWHPGVFTKGDKYIVGNNLSLTYNSDLVRMCHNLDGKSQWLSKNNIMQPNKFKSCEKPICNFKTSTLLNMNHANLKANFLLDYLYSTSQCATRKPITYLNYTNKIDIGKLAPLSDFVDASWVKVLDNPGKKVRLTNWNTLLEEFQDVINSPDSFDKKHSLNPINYEHAILLSQLCDPKLLHDVYFNVKETELVLYNNPKLSSQLTNKVHI